MIGLPFQKFSMKKHFFKQIRMVSSEGVANLLVSQKLL